MQAQDWFPWVFSAGNTLSIALTMHGKAVGYLVLIPTQLAAPTYFLLTAQPGFLLGNFVMSAAGAIGAWKWWQHGVHRDGRVPAPTNREPQTAADEFPESWVDGVR